MKKKKKVMRMRGIDRSTSESLKFPNESTTGEDMGGSCRDVRTQSILNQNCKDAISALVRIYTPNFEELIEAVIARTDASKYDALDLYRIIVRQSAEEECWMWLEDLMDRAGRDETVENPDAFLEIFDAFDQLIGNLIQYRFGRRLYETYRAKKQNVAYSEHS